VNISKLTLGMGDRFAHQADAQLRACILAADAGVEIIPVWNKSNREHITIGSEPASTRQAADAAVKAAHWTKPYHIDADHIRLDTVDRFLPHSDFFTIDVADSIGKPATEAEINLFVGQHPEMIGAIRIPGIDSPFQTTREWVRSIARKYLAAVADAAIIYRYIAGKKRADSFIIEVSMDETDAPQTPPELLVILAALHDAKVPLQTIAPKFTGRFNKGVDYAGDLARFEKEFNDDLAVIGYAIRQYGLPATLKLSVHSGSDKFSLYPIIRRALLRTGAGVHLKTAGTTWLEELIGLAEEGGSGLELAKEIYAEAYAHRDELCAPYATVIDIRPGHLPEPAKVKGWSSEQYVSALRHDQNNPGFNADLRQLLHVGYKVAARKGQVYLDALKANRASISRNVTENLFKRHIKPLFGAITE
jgi:hypothetical protein